MSRNEPVLNINTLKTYDEEFMHTVDGTLRIDYINEMFYSFLPYPFYYGLSPIICTNYVKCTMAVTDKRIIIIGKNDSDTIDEKHIYSFNYKNIKSEFKKKLGGRTFILDIRPQRIFNFLVGSIVFEVTAPYINQAEYINQVISQYLKKVKWRGTGPFIICNSNYLNCESSSTSHYY